MLGLMQQRPLLISTSDRLCGDLSRRPRDRLARSRGRVTSHQLRRSREAGETTRRRVESLDVAHGERVATLAWNSYRHLELYYGVTSSGRVLHTVNPRLFPGQIQYIIHHAEGGYVFFDPDFRAARRATRAASAARARLGRALRPRRHAGGEGRQPALLRGPAGGSGADFEWPQFDENTASTLCYTSGTTGNPKGVLYSHRSTILHAFAACSADGFALRARDSILVVVPLFHANAWSLPFSAAMCGAKLVLPGPKLDPESIYHAAGAGGLHQGWRHSDDLAQLPRLDRKQSRRGSIFRA